MDEERRLFYVAVTRAKDRLYMITPKSRRSPEGGCYPVEASVFVKEIPSQLYDERVVKVDPSQFWDGGYGGGGYGGDWRGGGYGGGYGGGSSHGGGWRGGGGSRGGGWRGGPSRGGRSGGVTYKTTWRR